jgi:ferredoxin--NADP+ reductase
VYEIIAREELAPVTKLIEVHAPELARKCRAGQFAIVRVTEEGERIPLTFADFDQEKGTVTLIFQEVGKTTYHLGTLEVGDALASLTGPLGNATEIERYGTVLCIGGGVGIAAIYPIARALHEAGNQVISIIGARSRELLFWEDRMRGASDELIICTDDGSYGRKALVTEPEKELLESGRTIDRLWVVGPAVMMKFASFTSQPFEVKTIVSLNPIMVDGTGMCGGCRVEVGGRTYFACVDGPEFDGHQVDWDLLMARQRIYLEQERESLERFRLGSPVAGAREGLHG